MKIIFMGTPEFAVPTLENLCSKHEVVAVYTQAPKPAGRGHKETLSPIHNVANKHNLSVFTPKTLRTQAAQAEFLKIQADVVVVVAYGLILPKEILTACKYGCINVHPSLLPFYRGAAPMQRTILAGEEETAMCIIKMDEGIDTGDILMIEKTTLPKNITYTQLSNQMAHLGADLMLKVLDKIDKISPIKQIGEGNYAHKIEKQEAELNWKESSEILVRKVRALNPWPGTYFYSGEEKIKVLEAKAYDKEHNEKPGTITDEKQLIIACGEGFFQPTIMQRAGKKPMDSHELIRGYKLQLT